ncbi:transcription antitermination factor NusB [Neosynechococcus sphagnicola]|uniref:transcription antitermination factor NusB n=1 Tax=Neosynechococcus sphagnicola TaxID=1501145 RepID=UPI000AEAF278
MKPISQPRQLAFLALRAVHRGAFADVALDRVLQSGTLAERDRRLVTELVYGSLRRQRTLDALIDQIATRPAEKQPADLRLLFHLGLYQLRYLTQIPAAAAVNTTVELAKQNRLGGLAGLINGCLRQYLRLTATQTDPLELPSSALQQLGILHSYPDWIVETWQAQIGWAETAQICEQLNQPPYLDLRINPLRTTLEEVETALATVNIQTCRLPPRPPGVTPSGSLRQYPAATGV